MDWRLFVALTVVTALVVLVVGVGSALSATRVSPASVLGGAPLGAGGTPRDVRARRLLVGGQVALALVVLSSASLPVPVQPVATVVCGDREVCLP